MCCWVALSGSVCCLLQLLPRQWCALALRIIIESEIEIKSQSVKSFPTLMHIIHASFSFSSPSFVFSSVFISSLDIRRLPVCYVNETTADGFDPVDTSSTSGVVLMMMLMLLIILGLSCLVLSWLNFSLFHFILNYIF